MALDLPSILVSTLGAFIATNIPALTVLEEFPYANQELKFPSLTITTTKPTRTPMIPELDSQSDVVDGMVTANIVVAQWDDTFQLDL